MMGDDPLNGYKRGWKQAKGNPKISNDPNRSKMPASYKLIRLGQEVVQIPKKLLNGVKSKGFFHLIVIAGTVGNQWQYEATEASVVFDVDVRLPRVFVGIEIAGSSCAGKTFCAATQGRSGMVFTTRWPCFAAVVLATLAATVAKRRLSFRSTCPASSAAAKTFFRGDSLGVTFYMTIPLSCSYLIAL